MNLPPIPRDCINHVMAHMPKGCEGVVYREWYRTDRELQCYVIYEIDPRECRSVSDG